MVLIFYVGVEGGVAEVGFAACADVVALGGLVAGAALALVLLYWWVVVALVV